MLKNVVKSNSKNYGSHRIKKVTATVFPHNCEFTFVSNFGFFLRIMIKTCNSKK